MFKDALVEWGHNTQSKKAGIPENTTGGGREKKKILQSKRATATKHY